SLILFLFFSFSVFFSFRFHSFFFFFFSSLPRPPISTLFPYTTLFRSLRGACRRRTPARGDGAARRRREPRPRRSRRRRAAPSPRSEEHTSELQSRFDLVCRLLLEKKNKKKNNITKQYI